MRTCFNKSTLATCRCARFDRSKETRVFIRPHDHATTVAALCCIGCDACVITNESPTRLRSIRRIASEIIAADSNAAAAGCAICIHECIAKESDAIAKDVNRSALARAARCIKSSVHCKHSALAAACCDALAHDRSRKIHRERIEIAIRHGHAALARINRSSIGNRGLRSSTRTISSHLRSADCDHHGTSSILNENLIASAHRNIAITNINRSAIGDILSDKRNGLCLNETLVGHLANKICESISPCNEISVAHRSSSGEESADIDDCAIANAKTLRIDEIHNSIRKQCSIDAS